jgi:hypothetical protein
MSEMIIAGRDRRAEQHCNLATPVVRPRPANRAGKATADFEGHGKLRPESFRTDHLPGTAGMATS